MPTMANVTVKKADGVTDIVYTALTSSPGDNSPARWSAVAANQVAALRPTVEFFTRFNAKKDARHVSMITKVPEVVTINSVDTINGTVLVTITAVTPLQVKDSTIAEAIAQSANLYKATLIQDSYKAGYAPQ